MTSVRRTALWLSISAAACLATAQAQTAQPFTPEGAREMGKHFGHAFRAVEKCGTFQLDRLMQERSIEVYKRMHAASFDKGFAAGQREFDAGEDHVGLETTCQAAALWYGPKGSRLTGLLGQQ